MRIIVNPHKLELEKEEIINAGEYNVQECTFEFSEEYDNLVKVAIFSSQTNSFKVNINDTNKCIIPYEVLENENIITVGVYGYEVDGDELIKRYSPSPEHFKVENGSYKVGEEVDPPSPSIIEQIQEEIERLSNEISTFEEEQETQNTNISNLQEFKVDKVIGKGLSTNDYTNKEKQKLSNLENYDDTEVKQDISNIKQEQTTQNSNIQTNTNNISDLQTTKADRTEIPDVSDFITRSVNNLTYYTLKTSTGSLIDLEINSSTFVVTLKLKDIDGNVISTDSIDLPLESVVVNGSYDSVNKKIVLTLQNGNTIDVFVGDLVSGLQTEITSQNKLASDLIDDTNSGNKFVSTSEKNTWNAKSDFSGNYNDLTNQPSINNVILNGNKTTTDLGINIPTKTSDLNNDSGFITNSTDNLLNYYKKSETFTKEEVNDLISEIGGSSEASGSIITVKDAAAKPLIACGVGIEPIQGGSGVPSPSNVRPITGWTECNVIKAGKNLAQLTYGSKVPSTSTGEMVSSYGWSSDFYKLDKTKNYVASTTTSSRYIMFYDENKAYLGYIVTYANGYVLNSNQYWSNAQYIKHRSDAGQSSPPDIQLEIGSTATTYEPYNETTYNIQFPSQAGTVYGGTLDVVNGELTVDRAMVDMGSLSYTYYQYGTLDGGYTDGLASVIKKPPSPAYVTKSICSELKEVQDLGFDGASDNMYSINVYGRVKIHYDGVSTGTELKTAMNGVQLVYELATPLTIELDPTTISLLEGTNNIFADSGDTDIIYIRDVNLFINQLDARVKALENE